VLRNGAGRERACIWTAGEEKRRDFEAGGGVRRVVAGRVTRLMPDVAERRLPRLGFWTVLRTSR
jgi:hypothetical protein